MTKIDFACDLPLSAAEMFVERDSAAFQSLMCKALNLSVMEFRNCWRDDANDADIVELITKPDIEQYVPKHLKRYLTFDLVFVDLITYKHDNIKGPTYMLSVDSKLPFLKDNQYSIKTQLSIKPLGPNRCRQRLTSDVKINVLGVGSVVSGIVLNSLKQAYQTLPQVVERWVQFKAQMEQTPEGRATLMAGRPELKSFPTHALEVLKKPYEVEPEEEVLPPEEELSTERSKFTGELRAGSAIYFDAVDYYNVDCSDEATKGAVMKDKMDLLQWGTADVELELDSSDQESDSEAEHAVPPIPEELTPGVSHEHKHNSPFHEDWNRHRSAWSKLWDDVGVASAKIPNMPARIVYYADSMASMGKLKFLKEGQKKKHHALNSARSLDDHKKHYSFSQGVRKVRTGVKHLASGVGKVPGGVVRAGEYMVEGVTQSFSEIMKRPPPPNSSHSSQQPQPPTTSTQKT